MSAALSISQDSPMLPPAPRGVEYIDVETAAKRCGSDVDSFRRRWLPKFRERGFAKLMQRNGVGAAVWHVREDADGRLARIRSADDLPADLKTLNDAQRKSVLQKKAILDALESFANSDASIGRAQREIEQWFIEFLAAGKLPVKLAQGMKLPGDRTLRNWKAAYRRDGLAGLFDERTTRQQKPVQDDPFFKLVDKWHNGQQRRTAMLCWELACHEAKDAGVMVRSYKQTLRYLAKAPKGAKSYLRDGPSACNDKFGRYIERDYSKLQSNEIWCPDHHQFDVMVMHNGKHIRPWLTAFEDVRSRKIVGWHISATSGNTDTILLALAMGIDSHGVPLEIYADNGKDFDSKALQGITKKQRRDRIQIDELETTGVMGSLGITVNHVWPYHGQSKPIERFFGTLEDRFGRLQPTYCGSCPQKKPENLAAKLNRKTAPLLAEFIEAFSLWLEGDYHSRAHFGDGMNGKTPAQAFDACLEVKRTVPASIREVMLWKPEPLTRVGRHGVRCDGISYGANDPALIELSGRDVIVRVDPSNVSRAAICLPDGQWKCMVQCNERLPFKATQEEKREAIGKIKAANKLTKKAYETRMQLHTDVASAMHQTRADNARREREVNPPPAPNVAMIQTTFSGDQARIEAALKEQQPLTPARDARKGLEKLKAAMAKPDWSNAGQRPVLNIFAEETLDRIEGELLSKDMSWRALTAKFLSNRKREGDEPDNEVSGRFTYKPPEVPDERTA